MNGNLQTYRARLTVLGPVFVGSGNELSKKEYVFLNRLQTVGIVDMQKFYRMVSQKGLRGKFEDFMLDSRAKRGLSDWIKENGISLQEIRPYLRYEEDSGVTAIQRGTPLHIMECVKDPYGMPYIPGSSIKGMLRTILLNGEIAENPEKYRRERMSLRGAVENSSFRPNRNQFLQAEKRQVEEARFYRLTRNEKRRSDAVNDELSGMIVSDSAPLKIKDLVLCQKVDRRPDGTEKKLNLLRECIRPGTKIDFTITLEKNICTVTRDEILHSAEVFNGVYYDCFLRAFRGIDRPLPNEVYLGGGAGFVSKTFIYSLMGRQEGLDTTVKIFRNTGVPEQHKHRRDYEYGASPHIVKCTNYQGQSVPMGRCRLEIF